MEKFKELGISGRLLDILEKEGISKPTEIQEKAIPHALKGKDLVGGSATGSGKTLAFASSIAENLKPEKKVQALILTPTRELAEQVSGAIEKFSKGTGLKTLSIYGGVSIENQIRKLSITDIVIGTPGRILDHLNRGTLNLEHVKVLVLDEVDKMFDMGFHHDVEKIINECPEERQTMMFSATISEEVDYFARKYTKNPEKISVKSYVDPSKLKQVFYDVPSGLKFSLLVHLLKEDSESVMVFCSTRKNVDFITSNLKKQGINAIAIHGGMPQNKRINTLESFHKKGGVLVCTDVAARGLDIKNVSHVYNYDLPSDADSYIHRIGRTARAGKEGKAIVILSSRDYQNFSSIQNNTNLEIKQEKLPFVKKVETTMFDKKEKTGFRGRQNSGSFRRNDNQRRNSGSRDNRHSRDKNSFGRNRDQNRSSGNNSQRNRNSNFRSKPKMFAR